MKRTSNVQPVSTKAGWYPDPTQPQTQRYWDGDAWSEHRAPLPPKQGGVSVWTIAVGILIAVVVVIGGYSLLHANDDISCAVDNADRAQNGRPALTCPE